MKNVWSTSGMLNEACNKPDGVAWKYTCNRHGAFYSKSKSVWGLVYWIICPGMP